MTDTGEKAAGSSETATRQTNAAARQRISFLDQALWRRFAEAGSLDDYTQAWLGLQCRLFGPEATGVVVLGGGEEGARYQPVAFWPDEDGLSAALTSAAERALAERRGIAQGLEEHETATPVRCAIGYPIFDGDRACGAVAIELMATSRGQLRSTLRQLQWGVGHIVAALRREELVRQQSGVERIDTVFELVADALEYERFATACNALVTELAIRLECDQVSIGFRHRRHVVVAAVSNTSQFGKRMSLTRDIGRVMDEAVDQQAVVLYPPRGDWDFRVDREHADLAGVYGGATILTVPIHTHGRFIGALTAERRTQVPFDDDSIELFDCVAGVVGPILEAKRQNDRSIFWKLWGSLLTQARRLFGPRYFGRKIAALAIAGIVALLATATGTYRVTSPASIQGSVERAIVAPFDGYIADERVRAGEQVRSGAVLAQLDTRDMVIERLRWETERNTKATEYDRALASHERAKAAIIKSEIEQVEAQIRLLDIQIARATLRAPYDGILLSGDLSQFVGGAIRRGEEMFRISPLNSYRVELEIDERDISEIEPGQRGQLIVTPLPQEQHPYVVRRVTPVSESREGRTFFRVEAELEGEADRLQPGMGGVAKTKIDSRLLVLIWSDRLLDWARIFVWKWLP